MKTDKPMTSREQQRIETRIRIVEAAVEAFAERGFHGASTREIAARCGVTQGLVTYHFQNKDTLWREAATHLCSGMLEGIRTRVAAQAPETPRALARAMVRAYVLLAAERPAVLRLMMQESHTDDERVQWLVDTHLRMMHQSFVGLMTLAGVVADAREASHLYYSMVGAGSLMFGVQAAARRLTGLDPGDPAVIERHADFVAALLVPELPRP